MNRGRGEDGVCEAEFGAGGGLDYISRFGSATCFVGWSRYFIGRLLWSAGFFSLLSRFGRSGVPCRGRRCRFFGGRRLRSCTCGRGGGWHATGRGRYARIGWRGCHFRSSRRSCWRRGRCRWRTTYTDFGGGFLSRNRCGRAGCTSSLFRKGCRFPSLSFWRLCHSNGRILAFASGFRFG